MDNTNFDLIKTLSVRANADWHDQSYRSDVQCDGCRRLFDRLHAMDQEAVQLLSEELAQHINQGVFPGNSIVAAR